jgi:alpha-1,2-mannosyltransferase
MPTVAVVGAIASAVALLLAWAFGPDFDFFDLRIYYKAVSYWLDGHDIYDYWQSDPVNVRLGYTYPPVAAVLMAPLATLPVLAAAWVTAAATVLAGFGCVWICFRAAQPRQPATAWQLTGAALLTVAMFQTQPLVQTLAYGQVNVYLALLVLIDALVLLPKRSKWTGIGVGLALAIKLTPGIFLLYFLVNKQWRAMIVAVLTAAAATLLAALVAPSETWRYFTDLIFNSDRVGFLNDTMNQSINGLLARVAAPDQPSRVVWALLCLAVLVIGLLRARRAVLVGNQLTALTLIGLVGLLISPASWIHHAVWVIPAVLLSAWWLIDAVRATAPIWRIVTTGALLTGAVYVWIMDSRQLLDIQDQNPQGLGYLASSSLQVLWLLAAVPLLPIRQVSPTVPAAVPASPRPAS